MKNPQNIFVALIESKNYVNKTIKKLVDSNGNPITDQKEILNTVKDFYKDLFSNKDEELQDVNLNTLFEENNDNPITKLSDKEKTQ